MSDEPQEQPSREELLEARDKLTEQLSILRSPAWAPDRNDQLIAKLEAMLDEIERCLGEGETDGDH